jgi:YihY family inner membrane protein
MSSRLEQKTRRVWAILSLAVKKYLRIDGAQWAAAFAYHAFFSLFPLMVLLVTIASFFVDRDRAGTDIIGYVERYVPMSGPMQRTIIKTVSGVVHARGQAGVVAFLLLVWVAIQCFTTLIGATNRAWGDVVYSWWRLPVKSLFLFGIMAVAVLLSIAVTVLATMAKVWLFPVYDLSSRVSGLGSFFVPLVAVFFSLSMLYKFAPRRLTRFAEVWTGALCATVLLQAAESLFVIYLKDFATLNAVYGAFGGIMALLLWIYFSGCIFIFGACLCAAQAEALLPSMQKREQP